MELRSGVNCSTRPPSRAGGSAPEAYAFVDWLAAAGAALVAGPAARIRPTGTARRTPPRPRSRPGPACSPTRTRRSPTARSTPFARAERVLVGDWVDVRGRRRVADQVRFEREWGALRAYAARAGRPARSATSRSTSAAGERATTAAIPSSSSRRVRGGGAARPAQRPGTALGQPPLRLGRARARGLPLVDRAAAADARSSSTCSGSTTSAASPRYWAVPRRRRPARDGRWSPGPGDAHLPRGGARARAAAGDRRGPRRDHAGRRRAARRARLPRHGRAPLGLRRPARQPSPAREPPRATRSSTPRPTTPTRCRRLPRRSDPWELIELALSSRAALAMVPAQDVLGLGSEARMNRPGQARRELVLAARARPADPGARRRPPRRHRELRAAGVGARLVGRLDSERPGRRSP